MKILPILLLAIVSLATMNVYGAPGTAEKNLQEGVAFLKMNKEKPGVVTLPSGLQYKIVKEGKGNPPGPSDFVTVNYKGSLIDGTVFDQSNPKAPTSFAVNAVIPGWTEALQKMKPGSHWVLYIPPNLAYGARGAGPKIGPNASLIFDVELISFIPSAADTPAGTLDEWEDMD